MHEQERSGPVPTTRIPNSTAAAREVAAQVVAEAEARGYSPEAVFAIKLALEEALTNAIRHGNRRDPAKMVRFEYSVSPTCTEICIADQGGGFDPAAVPDPTADENLECPTGRGIMLMRAYMDHVEFNERGNAVRMVKFNRPTAP
ncbi:MAG: ATP-binding protein [Planctomycetes bacterium]|nr:ATP-binding protein [Planctomycetota bacterium]